MKYKFILITFLTFFIGNFFSFFINENNTSLIMSKINPPNIVFPIVWSILFLLMSISFYIIINKTNSKKYYLIYITQLIVNSLWTLIFFKLRLLFLAFLWILLLILIVVYMILEFYKIDRFAAYLQIPYLLWLIFAAYLNYVVYLLN